MEHATRIAAGFATLQWTLEFKRFYIHEHRHSGFRFVTPEQWHQRKMTPCCKPEKRYMKKQKSIFLSGGQDGKLDGYRSGKFESRKRDQRSERN